MENCHTIPNNAAIYFVSLTIVVFLFILACAPAFAEREPVDINNSSEDGGSEELSSQFEDMGAYDPYHGRDPDGLSSQFEDMGAYNPFHGWDPEGISSKFAGVSPAATPEQVNTSSKVTSSNEHESGSASNFQVIISPFTTSSGGGDIQIIIGYVGGTRTGVSLMITGKGNLDESFSDIVTIEPDANGFFVWAASPEKTFDIYRVVGQAGTEHVLSNSVSFEMPL
ncbi:MAG TPA: hypothetical protein VN372_12850 [Methanospirillum sp.]|nr:hypothetical protein [Methanospirillum sp.]